MYSTKLTVPSPAAGLVPRECLVEKLNASAGTARSLTLISAPAGYGKTTLLAEWVAGGADPVAWLTLDEGDIDPLRFIWYLYEAFKQVEPGLGASAMAALASPLPPPLEALVAPLVNHIEGLHREVCLVLDDYHQISSPSVHAALVNLLDHQPANLHLVIATRSDPPLPLARLRAGGRLLELRQDDLRFTTREAVEFLHSAVKHTLSAADTAALVSRTEAWPAGLRIAALSANARPDASRFIAEFTGSHHHVLDYLGDEVFERQPASVQSFLAETSILDRLCGSLCDALTGGCAGQAMLERLEHDNLFIVPLDDRHGWYRYHGLFVELLRHRLVQMRPDRVSALHRRASEWCESNGEIAPAVEHAEAAKDWPRVAALLGDHFEAFWGHGELAALRRWMSSLPASIVDSSPSLCITGALLSFTAGKLREAEERVRAAESLGGASWLNGEILVIRAHIARFRGDLQGTVSLAEQALRALPDASTVWRTQAALILGEGFRSLGDLSRARPAHMEALRMSRAGNDTYHSLFAGTSLAMDQLVLGRLHHSAELCRSHLAAAELRGFANTGRAGALHALLAEILCEWNELEEARDHVQRGLELTLGQENVAVSGFALLAFLWVQAARRDMPAFQHGVKLLEELSLCNELPVWVTHTLCAWKVWQALESGSLTLAEDLSRECGLRVDGEIPSGRDAEYLSFARLLARTGRTHEADHVLEKLMRSAEARGRTGEAIRTMLLRAFVLSDRSAGDRSCAGAEQAMPLIQRAIALAEPEGYVRVFIDEDARIEKMVRQAVGRVAASTWSRALLAGFSARTGGRPAAEGGGTGAAPSAQAEALSDRESEVLRLLNGEQSRGQIARMLYVSENTIRSHLKSIYGKLGVHSRHEALTRAAELKLLP